MPRGHKRDPERERYWRRTIKAWSRSGETVRGFCAKQGLSETAFHAWRRELRKRDSEGRRRGRSKPGQRRGGTPVGLRFLPVRIATTGEAGPTSIEIEQDGTTIRLRGAVDPEALVHVLEAVRRVSC